MSSSKKSDILQKYTLKQCQGKMGQRQSAPTLRKAESAELWKSGGKRTKCCAVASSKTKFKTKGGRGNEQLFNIVFFSALCVYCLSLLCFTQLTVETINILRTITRMQLSCYNDTIPLLGEWEFCTYRPILHYRNVLY